MQRLRPFLLPIVLLLILGAVSLMLSLRQRKQDPIRDHSIVRSNKWGTKALAELCRAHGLPALAWTESLSLLSPKQRLLCIFDPSKQFAIWDLEKLAEWVREGGTLIIGAHLDETHNLMYFGSSRVSPDEVLLAAFGLQPWQGAPARVAAVPALRSPWLRDVHRLHVPGTYRLRVGSRDDFTRRHKSLGKDEGATDIRPLVSLAWQTLAWDDQGPVALAAAHGKGRVLAVCEVEMFANENISRADNAVLIANLLFTPRAPKAYFDEHLHMVRVGMSEEAAELDPSRANWALAAALAVFALFMVGRALRFGAPVPVPLASRRSDVEYVEALADLYRRAQAQGAVLEIIQRSFRHRLAAVVGASPELADEALAEAVASRKPVSAERIRGLLAQLREAGAGHSLTEAQLLTLTRQINAVEEALSDGR